MPSSFSWPGRRNAVAAAFTLVELLIAISIVAILVALALPSLMRARQSALQAACSSNLKNVAQGVTLYVADNNGQFPPGYSASHAMAWQQDVAPYLGAQKTSINNDPGYVAALNCPSVKAEAIQSMHQGKSSYAINQNLLASRNGGSFSGRFSAIRAPSQVVLAGDSIFLNSEFIRPMGTTGGGMAAFRHPSTIADYPPYTIQGQIGAYGTGRANLIFCDGHVAAMTPAEAAPTATSDIWTP